jgi:hypothetical protein
LGHPPPQSSGAASPTKTIPTPTLKNGIGAGAVAPPFRAQGFATRKRQRAGALQDASRCRESQKFAPASWTAAALRRFSRSAAMVEDLAAACPLAVLFPYPQRASHFHPLRLVLRTQSRSNRVPTGFHHTAPGCPPSLPPPSDFRLHLISARRVGAASKVGQSGSDRKRQRAGALQDASRCRKSQKFAPASWTAAALRRFSRSAAVSETSRSTSIRREISVSATRHSFPPAATGAAHTIALLILIQFDNHTRFH